jgi:hypothetical protein
MCSASISQRWTGSDLCRCLLTDDEHGQPRGRRRKAEYLSGDLFRARVARTYDVVQRSFWASGQVGIPGWLSERRNKLAKPADADFTSSGWRVFGPALTSAGIASCKIAGLLSHSEVLVRRSPHKSVGSLGRGLSGLRPARFRCDPLRPAHILGCSNAIQYSRIAFGSRGTRW